MEKNNVKNELSRLPCRGCLHSCKHYTVCQGRLWRVPGGHNISNEKDQTKVKMLAAK